MIWLWAVLGLYLLLIVGVAWFSIHPPRTPVFVSPGALGASQEDASFETADGITLKAWWVGRAGSDCVAVLCHGYLMCRSELAPLAATLWKQGFSSVLLDFRAHGKSGGTRCGFGYREVQDLRAAVTFARRKQPNARIVLIGSSMGSAAAAFALSQDPHLADALVLDSCYSRLSSAVGGWWRFLGGRTLSVILWPCVWLAGPLAGLNPRRIDVAAALRGVDGNRVLLLHGTSDNLALPKDAERNAAACVPPAKIVWFADCRHSEGRWIEPERYEHAVLAFLEATKPLADRKPG